MASTKFSDFDIINKNYNCFYYTVLPSQTEFDGTAKILVCSKKLTMLT